MSKTTLGARLAHESAYRHVSGEARYTDDFPEPLGLLRAMTLTSPHAHAKILRRDASAALQLEGVVAVLFASDVPAHNDVGPIFHDEPLLATDAVHCVGQNVALILGESLEACRAACDAVVVEYEELPAVTDLAAGIAKQDFHGDAHVIRVGDIAAGLEASPHRLSGICQNGGQEHFYLETHCSLAVPGEDRTITVICSTQHPAETQALVAEQLGWPRNRVVVECPRMGGGFGGKETQAAWFACLAAVGVVKTGRPVKFWLDRDTDMYTTGRRHPFHTDWEVGFDAQGRVLALKADLYSDGGWAADLSLSILDRALFHVDNAYWLPCVELTGTVVKTNRVSNTAFRGFGGPQGMCVIEHIMERIAEALGADPLAVRAVNYYGGENNHTPYGQLVDHFRIPRIVDELVDSSRLHERRREVAAFNAANEWRKRGIALTPVKFGISFTAAFLNQAGAFVLIYGDGTVQLNHGGTEMGQGLYTKMMQICAHDLGIDPSRIRPMATRTDKVPNTSATAASSGADLNGAAIADACSRLVERLRQVAADLLEVPIGELCCAAGSFESIPEADGVRAWAWHGDAQVTFEEVCFKAYMSQVCLAESGYYRTPDIHYDRPAGKGKPFHYFAYGCAVSEVEVNGFTGEWSLLAVDILHDVGDSLSKDMDLGQVEGAFVQGLGWLTMEELVFGKQGELLTHSPSTYKIPAVGDVPIEFRVKLLEDAHNPGVVHGSKAVGEPPFNLAISTHVALCRAVSAFGPAGCGVVVDTPATNEALLFGVERARSGG
jgi:xanthine dehydrogenase large subunit